MFLFFDSSRIAAGIVTFTAFIGAGSIIARKGDIKGFTTADSIWIVSAIGLMVTLGNYLFPILTTIIAFVVLRLGSIAERKMIVTNK
jgi:putative Mg2+ transporter-C (MgtC) family protein